MKIVEEADTFLHEKEELRGLLNSGHTRGAAFVVRTVGDDDESRLFSTWSPKAIALIGNLPDTLADRSVIIPMHRRTPGERVERLRLDRPDAFEDLRRRAAQWAADHLAELRATDPNVSTRLALGGQPAGRPAPARGEVLRAAGGSKRARAGHSLDTPSILLDRQFLLSD